MRINVAIPEEHVKAPVLDAALEAVTRLNESLIKSGVSPTSHQLIERGAIWKPEPPGDEHFDHGAIIASRGEGDCDDWAPLHAATLRVTGEDRGAVARVRKTGPKRWHATVYRSDGTEDDPSLKAGMPGGARVIGATLPWLPQMFRSPPPGINGMYEVRPHLALRPIADRDGQVESWQARADLPWHTARGNSPQDAAMVSLHMSPVSSQAIVGAVRGAWRLGLVNGANPKHLAQLSAIADACEGASFEELEQRYGKQAAAGAGQIVGSFFGKALRKIGKGVRSVAKGAAKLAVPALSLVPGGGLATAAFNAASPALKGSVLRQQHKAPAQRAPLQLSRAAPPRAAPPPGAAPAPAAGTQWLPYPYPLPYPVPGWDGASPAPGVAWPPRG